MAIMVETFFLLHSRKRANFRIITYIKRNGVVEKKREKTREELAYVGIGAGAQIKKSP